MAYGATADFRSFVATDSSVISMKEGGGIALL